MSIHNQPERLIPPDGVCLNPPRLFNLNCKDCKYFEGTLIRKKGIIRTINKTFIE